MLVLATLPAIHASAQQREPEHVPQRDAVAPVGARTGTPTGTTEGPASTVNAPEPASASTSSDADSASSKSTGSSTAGPPDESVPGDRAPKDRITPPEPLNTPVQPIEGITQRIEIVLQLTLDAKGHVIAARAQGGEEPFASRAIESTRAWSFRPATKGGEPRASKVAFLVTFEPPPPPSPAADSPAADAKGPGASPARAVMPPPRTGALASAVPIQEVLILGELPDPGARGFTRYETRKLPGAFDDPLRSIEVLPGVSPILTGLPLFFVRGAPPGNVGYFVDGIRVPQLYHAFLGPSVIHPAFINRVDLHAGPMPARFGRYAGAALDAQLAEPHGELRAEASVRLLDMGGFAEAPFAQGRGYAMVGARYSYTALLLSALSPNQRLDYWDYQGLFGYRLTPKDEVSIFAFGSYDFAGSSTRLAGTEFHRVDARYHHDFSKRSRIRIALTTGADRSRSDVGFLRDIMFGARVNYEAHHDQVAVRAGADIIIDDYSMYVSPTVPSPEVYEDLFPPRTDAAGGAHLELVLFPEGSIQVIPGVRADLYTSLGEAAVGVDPRLAAQYQLTPWLRASHSVGMAHQMPSFVPNVPGAQVAGLRGGLQETLQAATNYEMKLPWDLTFSAGGFANVTTNLSDPIGGTQTLAVDETSADVRILGRALGIELYLKRPLTRRIGGLLSYTYSTTLRSSDYISTISGYDRPHVLNLALAYDLGKHWEAAAKLALSSGIPGRRTTLDGFVFDGDRSMPLGRLDVKISKRFYPTEKFNWGIALEVLNATYAPSVARRICGIRGCHDEGTAPIVIPNIGVDAAWN